MAVHTLNRELFIPRPAPDVFDFFKRAENLETITPPWLKFKILTPQPVEMKQGAKIAYRLRLRGIPLTWLTEIALWDPPFQFVDTQLKGPYKLWQHMHRFLPVDGGTRMTDRVDYALPFGVLGELVHRLVVARDVAKIFDFRASRIRELLG
jgi:ligand-binding SRPBCC domain-containing protein